jgi:hypothetical protein
MVMVVTQLELLPWNVRGRTEQYCQELLVSRAPRFEHGATNIGRKNFAYSIYTFGGSGCCYSGGSGGGGSNSASNCGSCDSSD